MKKKALKDFLNKILKTHLIKDQVKMSKNLWVKVRLS